MNKKSFTIYIYVFILTFLISGIALWQGGYAPFGDSSLMAVDANIQYRYFFSYLKDILHGKNSPLYSFSIGLGQTGIGIITYYLMSPFNLLILLFEKSEINTFFDLIVLIKLSFSSITMLYFLRYRFTDKLSSYIQILLSVSWGLCQYSLEQLDNIMWIDGVIMLPLFILAVHKLIFEKKFIFLTIVVAISIIIQWYTAGINCIFAVIWFIFEYLSLIIDNKSDSFLKSFFMFISALVLGVLISAVLFLPTIKALQSGVGGNFDWFLFKDEYKGNVLTAFVNYSIGAQSSEGKVSLYAGSFVLVGCIGALINKSCGKKQILYLYLFSICLMLYYWLPFFGVFSLLKDATSYYYRYSYVSIFVLIYIASAFYSESEIAPEIIRCTFYYVILLFIINKLLNMRNEKDIYQFSFILLSISLFIFLSFSDHIFLPNIKKIARFCLFIIICFEQYLNTSLLFNSNRYSDVNTYRMYMQQLEELSNKIHDEDKSNYRVSLIPSWISNERGITAYYSELMSIAEKGIASYNSSPDYLNLSFLDKVGYRTEHGRMSIVNTSILPIDSLLGVKYIISATTLEDYNLLENYPAVNDKKAYYNKFALPMAFRYIPYYGSGEFNEINPFEYINSLYTRLSCNEEKIFKPITTVRTETEDSIRWTFSVNLKDAILYGNIPWNYASNVPVDINGEISQIYNGWLAPSVFRMPYHDGENYIQVKTKDKGVFSEAQVYWCDESTLAEHLRWMLDRGGEVDDLVVENGYIYCHTIAEPRQRLFLSVPANEGWKLYRNRELISYETFANTFIDVPLLEGENVIELKYTLPGGIEGGCTTIIGILLTILINYLISKQQKARKL